MIHFNCPDCGGRVRVPDKYAGKKGRCPNCKVVIDIPTAKKAAADEAVQPGAGKSSADTATAPAAAAADDQAVTEAESLKELAAAAQAVQRPEQSPPSAVKAGPPQPAEKEGFREEEPVVTKIPREQAAVVPAVSAEKAPAGSAASPKADSQASAVVIADPAAVRNAKWVCLALYGLFNLCLFLWLINGIAGRLVGAWPQFLPMIFAALNFLGGAFALVYIPLRWPVITQLPGRYKLLGYAGGAGLALLLTLTTNPWVGGLYFPI